MHVIVNHLDGTCHLLGPAPGEAYDELGDRRWIAEITPPQTLADAMALLERRIRFDPDLWMVEVEDRKGMAGLTPTPEGLVNHDAQVWAHGVIHNPKAVPCKPVGQTPSSNFRWTGFAPPVAKQRVQVPRC